MHQRLQHGAQGVEIVDRFHAAGPRAGSPFRLRPAQQQLGQHGQLHLVRVPRFVEAVPPAHHPAAGDLDGQVFFLAADEGVFHLHVGEVQDGIAVGFLVGPVTRALTLSG